MEENNYNKEKSNWDSRKEYSQILKKSIEHLKICEASNDIRGWLSALEFHVNLVERSIGTNSVNNIRKRIRKIRTVRDIKLNGGAISFISGLDNPYYEENKLNELTGELIRLSSDLLIPYKQEDDPTKIDDIIKKQVGSI